jgi:hypothetical protein
VRLAHEADDARLDRVEHLLELLFGLSDAGRAARRGATFVDAAEGAWARRAAGLVKGIQDSRRERNSGAA